MIGARLQVVDQYEQVLAQWNLEWRGDGVHFPEDTAAYCQRAGVPVRVRFIAHDGDEMFLRDADRADDENQWGELLIDDVKPLRKNQIVSIGFELPEEPVDVSRALEGAVLEFVGARGVLAEMPAAQRTFVPEWIGLRGIDPSTAILLRVRYEDGSMRLVESDRPPLSLQPGESFEWWTI
jgi:hypothetical protein